MSRRALAFVSEVVAAHGRYLDGQRVDVPLSQAELARRYRCSAGTVAYHLHQVGDVVLDRRRGGIVVDLAALGAAQEQSAGPRHLRLATTTSAAQREAVPTSTPSPALSGDQVIEVVSTLARCLTQVSSDIAAMADQLLSAVAGAPANPASPADEIPRDPAGSAAGSAAFAGVSSFDSVPRKEESLPFFDQPLTRESREPRGEATTGTPSPTGCGTPLPYDLVDELVAPLRAHARRCGRPDTIDDNGRQLLASLSEPQLRHGVERTLREVAADDSIRKPLGLLVHKVLTAREDFFALPVPVVPPALVVAEPEIPLDEEAIAAVAALEGSAGDELTLVDEEVQVWLAANVARESTQNVMLRRDQRGLRQAAWRRLHPHALAG